MKEMMQYGMPKGSRRRRAERPRRSDPRGGKIRSPARWVRLSARSALLLTTLAVLASPAAAATVRGTVFEDVNYGGGAGRSLAGSSGVGRGGAIVELYDGTGVFVTSSTTAADGTYGFLGYPNGSYTVRVVNATVTSSRTGYVAGLLPVQTFRTDASTGVVVAVTDHVGGQSPAVTDAGPGGAGTVMNTTTGVFTAGIAGTAQSITNVTVAGILTGLDFGFNFDTIVNVNDSGQGSLRQFVLNSNALDNAGLAIQGQTAGRDVSIFMISDGQAHAGLRAGLANLLSGAGVAVITPATALPAITAADTSVDGTTQTANVGNTNAVVLGTGGTVGVDLLPLSTVPGPEVEIRGAGLSASGLLIRAATAVVRGLAILGFGTVSGEAGVRVDGFPAALIENNVLGSSATSFSDPGLAQRNGSGVYSNGGSNTTVRDNLIGFSRIVGIDLNAGTTGWTITGNEIRDNGMDQADGDGITINASSTNNSVGNLVTGSSSQGLIVTAGATGNVFTNNTVTGNGVGIPSGLVQSPGVVLRSTAASTVLDRNVIRANYGAGVQANAGSTGTRVTRNSFALNGTVTARNGGAATGQIGIDLNSPTDNIHLGTTPFYTLNDPGDVDTGANGLLNFPVLVWASLYGGALNVGGYARPGSVIELFVASPDPTGFGEGTTYGITLTEGGTGAGGNDPYPDLDAGTGTYGPGPVNGRAQGTDTTNRFAFFIPVPGGVGVGTQLTATATLGGETSEFSGNVTVSAATAVELTSFEATPSDKAVELSWRTASEVDNLGFHLYRAFSAEGPWERITASLIPGLGSSPEGARYGYRDVGLVNGVTYFYQLEDVETTGVTARHGPVSATPQAAASDASDDPTDPTAAWITYGHPEATSLRVVERGRRHAMVELVTGGFYARPDAEGGVWLSIPGFVEPDEPGAPALPVSRTWLEAVAGRKVELLSVRGHDVVAFSGLRPAVTGAPELWEEPDGTVRVGQRRRRPGGAFKTAGLYPEEAARLLGVAFQGDVKKAHLELSPLRWDRSGGQLLLARRLVVRVSFAGLAKDELAFGGSHGRKKPGARARPTDGVVARLATEGRGLYAVGFEELFGPRGSGVSVSELRLSRQGEAVAFHVEPAERTFGRGSVLYFVSAGASLNPYGQEAVYELSLEGNGVAMPPTSASPYGGTVPYHWQRLAQEVDRSYLPTLLTSPDPWLWDAVPAGAAKSYTLSVSGLADSGDASLLEVSLQGGSDYAADPDHHVRVSVNGHTVGEASWDGKQPLEVAAEVAPGVLHEGENLLQIENVGDTEASYSLVLLDRFALSYPRQLVATAGVLEGRFDHLGVAEILGLAAGALIVDTTETPERWVTGALTTPLGVSFRAEAGRDYLAVSAESMLQPEVRPASSSSLGSASNRADYVVLGPRAFLAAAEPLLEQRRGQGLEALGVAIEEVYDAFGHGESRPEAVRAFLGHAYHEWERAPRYVLLLGDATYDFKDHAATAVVNQVPPYMIKDTYMWTVSDPTYAAVNGEDLLPDLALGRLPAQTLGEAQALVQKVLDWEQAGFGFVDRAVMVADNADHAGDFEGDAERVASTLLAGHEVERIYLSRLGAAATRASIRDAFDRGSSLMSYMGHGAILMWASENVLSFGGVAGLSPQAEQPVLLTMNCLNGYFHFPFMNSLSEELVKAEGKGAIAAFSPSSMSVHWAASLYHEALVAELGSGRHARLGDAILAAQVRYADSGAHPELLSIYQLLGDPALTIR